MRVILLSILFAVLGLASGCQTNSASSDPYTKAVMDDFQKTRQKHDAMFAEMDRDHQERLKRLNEEFAPFENAVAEYKAWYNSLDASEKYTVDSVLEHKMIHRRIMQGPNGVDVYESWDDKFEVMAEYKQFFSH